MNSYDVVIATRNRPSALTVSVPLLLGQSSRPSKIIIIDSSDDHGEVVEAVRVASASSDIPIVIEHSSPGAAAQRNRGLEHVDSPVVFFPG